MPTGCPNRLWVGWGDVACMSGNTILPVSAMSASFTYQTANPSAVSESMSRLHDQENCAMRVSLNLGAPSGARLDHGSGHECTMSLYFLRTLGQRTLPGSAKC